MAAARCPPAPPRGVSCAAGTRQALFAKLRAVDGRADAAMYRAAPGGAWDMAGLLDDLELSLHG